MPSITSGKITLATEGESLVVYESARGRDFRRARFHLGQIIELVGPQLEQLLTGAARKDIEAHIGNALDGMFGKGGPDEPA